MKSMLFVMAVTCLAHGAALSAPAENSPDSAQVLVDRTLVDRTLGDERNGGHSLTCWYDESGAYTGWAPAPAGTTPGTKMQTAASGVHTWSYTVAGDDPAACPARLPVSTYTEH